MPLTSPFDTIKTYYDESDDRILHVELNRPEEENVITPQAVADIDDALRAADRDETVGGVVLGTSGNDFCAGGSLEKIKDMDRQQGNRFLNAYIDMVHLLRETGKPTVAAIEGLCVAGGNEIVMGSDVIVAGESARFGQPEVRVGSTAAAGGVQMLPLLVGEQRAKDLLLTGRLLSAEEAEDWGLINRVVPDGDASKRAAEIVQGILDESSPQAYRVIKSVIKKWNNLAMAEREMARELTTATWDSGEFRERAGSFLNSGSMRAREFSGTLGDLDEQGPD